MAGSSAIQRLASWPSSTSEESSCAGWQLDGWARGLALGDEFLFVGQSASRTEEGAYGDAAAIVVVDRDSWRIEEHVPMPCREIYDLVLAPGELLEGFRTGFRTNPLRVAEGDQADLFADAGISRPHRLWATGDPLPAEACRITIEATAPHRLAAGTVIEAECLVENRGDAILVSAATESGSPLIPLARGRWRRTDRWSPFRSSGGAYRPLCEDPAASGSRRRRPGRLHTRDHARPGRGQVVRRGRRGERAGIPGPGHLTVFAFNSCLNET